MIRRKRTKRGRGVLDFFKPVMSMISKAVENKDVIEKVAKDVVNISQNTRDLIKEMKKPEIVDRINRLRAAGTGFAYI